MKPNLINGHIGTAPAPVNKLCDYFVIYTNYLKVMRLHETTNSSIITDVTSVIMNLLKEFTSSLNVKAAVKDGKYF